MSKEFKNGDNIFYTDDIKMNGNSLNWKDSIGCNFRILYNGEIYKFKLEEYIANKNPRVVISLNGIFLQDTSVGNLKKCLLGRILGVITSEFKIEIGSNFKDKKRNIIITDRKTEKVLKNNGYYENKKYYKYKCLRCGFDCGEHWINTKNKEYKEEFWVLEHTILNGGGCPCCCDSPQITVPNINSIFKTNKILYDLILDKNETFKYTQGATSVVKFKCPDCGHEQDGIISYVNYNGFSCKYCSDGISFPEKIMLYVIKYFSKDYISQLSKRYFSWIGNYRYDFYFELNGEKYIIETHGMQHYQESSKKSNFKKTLKEEQENDRIKKELALSNGIKEENYIIIDCRYSNIDWIKQSIFNSKLNELYDLNSIDWLECNKFANMKLLMEICRIYNENINFTTQDVGDYIGISAPTVRRYLKKASNIGLTIYSNEESKLRIGKKISKSQSSKVEVFKDNVSLGVFNNAPEIEEQSEKLFGVKLMKANISASMNIKNSKKYNKPYKGFTFKYI